MRLLFVALIASLFVVPAVARADDTTPADFSGAHLGLDIGYGLGASGDWCLCTPIPLGTDAVGGDGGIFVGGEAGYGLRLGPLVLEASGRLSYADVNFADACGIGTCHGELDWLGEVFASAGVVVFDDILIAASAGYAAGDVSVSVGGAADDTSTHDGLMLGGRVEFGMPGGWRMGVEYRHYDMSGTNATAGGPVEIDWETEAVSFAIRYEL